MIRTEIDSEPVVLTGGDVIDGHGGPPVRADVRIEAGIVVAVGRGLASTEARVIEVTGATLMPGLIDAHTHFAPWATVPHVRVSRRLFDLAAETVASLEDAARGGLAAARDLGGLDPGFCDAIASGTIIGPAMLTSIVHLGPTNGIIDQTLPGAPDLPSLPGTPLSTADGVEECRRAVRSIIEAGADVVKATATGAVSSRRVPPDHVLFTREELHAITDEAHRAGIPVACHALTEPGITDAVEAGVDSIEHGCALSRETARTMASRGTWLVPTLSAYRLHAERGPSHKRERAKALLERHVSSLRIALDAGVRIGVGSDMGEYGFDFTYELACLSDAGLATDQLIAMVTSSNAALLGIDDVTGSIRPDKRADILVLSGSPHADVEVLRDRSNIRGVMRAGTWLTGEPTRS